MSYRSGVLTGLVVGALIVVAAMAVWQWSSPKPTDKAKAEPPATVTKTLKEDDVNTIKLTESAMQRLAIQVAAVRSEKVQRSRVYGGEVMVKPGQTVETGDPLVILD